MKSKIQIVVQIFMMMAVMATAPGCGGKGGPAPSIAPSFDSTDSVFESLKLQNPDVTADQKIIGPAADTPLTQITANLVAWVDGAPQSDFSYESSEKIRGRLISELSAAKNHFASGQSDAGGIRLKSLMSERFNGCMSAPSVAPDLDDWLASCAASNEMAFKMARIVCVSGVDCSLVSETAPGKTKNGGRSASGPSQPLADWTQELINYTTALPSSDFKNSSAKTNLLNKLNSALSSFQASNPSNGAADLELAMDKINGCQASPPAAEADDWVTNCTSAQYLWTQLSSVICAARGGGIGSITLSTAKTSFVMGDPSEQVTATGNFVQTSTSSYCSNTSSLDLTAKVSWSSSDPSVGTAASGTGMFSVLGAGTTNITATYGGVTSAALTMTVAAIDKLLIGSSNGYYTVNLGAPIGSWTISGPVALSGLVADFAAPANGSKIFVSNLWGKSILVFDALTDVQLSGSNGTIDLAALNPAYYPRYIGYDATLGALSVPAGTYGGSTGLLSYSDASPPSLSFQQTGPFSGTITEAVVAGTLGKIYAISEEDNAVLAFDASTGAQLSSISLGSGYLRIRGLTLGSSGTESKLYLVASMTQEVIVIDTATDSILNRFDLGVAGAFPTSITTTTDESKGYVTALDGFKVYVMDLSTGAVTKTLSASGYPYVSKLSPGGTRVFVQAFPYKIDVIDVTSDSIVTTLTSPGYVFSLETLRIQ